MRIRTNFFAWAIAACLAWVRCAIGDESVLSSLPQRDVEVGAVAPIVAGEDASKSFVPQSTAAAESNEEFGDLTYTVGDDFYTYYSRSPGLVGGTEVAFLRPYAAQRLMTWTDADMGFDFAYRTWIGYQSAEGLGGRLRFFQFDNAATGVEGLASLEFKTIDAEMTQRVDFRRWNLLLSGGVRQAESAYQFRIDDSPFNSEMRGGFAGVGLSFAAQATRELTSSGALQLTASCRWSSIFGNESEGIPVPTDAPHDELISIFELTFGPQYQRELSNGALLTIYGGLETQTWYGAITNGNDDIGLAGFTTGISILR